MVFWIVSASATLIAEERTVREKQLADAEFTELSIPFYCRTIPGFVSTIMALSLRVTC
jgi:hypothetical protein